MTEKTKVIRANFLNNEAASFLIDQIDIGLEADEIGLDARKMIIDFREAINNYSDIRLSLPPIN